MKHVNNHNGGEKNLKKQFLFNDWGKKFWEKSKITIIGKKKRLNLNLNNKKTTYKVYWKNDKRQEKKVEANNKNQNFNL